MKTTLYLVRHGATEANLAKPARLQGRQHNPPLAPLGVRQAEATRDLFAPGPIDRCFCSPLVRAVQTAQIIAAPHGLTPTVLDALTECDVGRWEGLDWGTICERDADAHRLYRQDPSIHGYPEGESFADVHRRAAAAKEKLFTKHPGCSMLVVSHHVVNRTYLAVTLGLPLKLARKVSLDNCGVSVIERDGAETTVCTVNAAFHLAGLAEPPLTACADPAR